MLNLSNTNHIRLNLALLSNILSRSFQMVSRSQLNFETLGNSMNCNKINCKQREVNEILEIDLKMNETLIIFG